MTKAISGLLIVCHVVSVTSLGFSHNQLIDVSGKHAYRDPGPDDARGPCPALNALANHGYLPRNGIATIPQFIQANNKVYGMGLDIVTILAVYGAVMNGNGHSWSIGGPSKAVSLPPIFGQPRGISYSHNNYEGDASATRGDLCMYGEAYKTKLQYFKELYSLLPPGPNSNYNMPVLTHHHANRLQQSISQNAFFVYTIIAGLFVVNLEHAFIVRMFSNHSESHPGGFLSGEVLKSFFAINGPDNNMTYAEGCERIPDNWYRRPLDFDYMIPEGVADLIYILSAAPQSASLGGNTGKVNSFVGVDLADITGGVFNSKDLLKGNNLMCLLLQFLQSVTPDFLKGTIKLPKELTSALGIARGKILELGCPQFTRLNMEPFMQFPGYTNSHSNGTCA